MASFEWSPTHLDLKRQLVPATAEERVTASWNDLLAELANRTAEIEKAGPNYIPQLNFSDLDKLTPEEISMLKRKGCFVVRGVVDAETASGWKTELKEIIKDNPHITGTPQDDIQYYDLYWSRPQVHARGHPNVLKSCTWASNLAYIKSGKKLDGVDLSVPLSYADRFRIRAPGASGKFVPPHIDGGGLERWADENLRRCFDPILAGNWRENEPFELEQRIDSRVSVLGKQGQQSVFRTFQGWLSMSETGPKEGTIQIFPELQLSNAYVILRPFFRPTVPEDSPDYLDPKNWKFDISTPDFPGLVWTGQDYFPALSPQSHPHLRLDKTLMSAPKVNPGDMIFWHIDTIHGIEVEHSGPNDSAVMFISAAPKVPFNTDYVARQLKGFQEGGSPPDYAYITEPKLSFGRATEADITNSVARVAMGLPIEAAA